MLEISVVNGNSTSAEDMDGSVYAVMQVRTRALSTLPQDEMPNIKFLLRKHLEAIAEHHAWR